MALSLIAQGQADAAFRLLSTATRLHPGDGRLAHLAGHVLLKLGLPGPAIGALYHALTLLPGNAVVHGSLAAALVAQGHADEAAAHAGTAFRVAPTAAHAATYSCALIEQGLLPEALAVTDDAIAIGHASAETWVNRSIALEGLGRVQEAEQAARDAARAAAGAGMSAAVEHHLATFLLTHGQLTVEAWTLYEARLRLDGTRTWPDHPRKWGGEDVRGKTVLLHAEQGLGDTLQFVRYAPLVAELGADVVLVVQPALKRLLAETPGVRQVLAVGEALPPCDVFSPLLSLPGLFGTTLASIPPPLPYGLLAARAPGPLRAGLTWAGNPTFVEDRKRSLDPALLEPLRSIDGIELFSLQLGPASVPAGITDAMGGVSDMADTAKRIEGLDLVICVDTAVAHLAATMSKPVWLLSRFRGCWRWLAGRADSPWYPGMTVYRQPRPGDWGSVLHQVRRDLAALADAAAPGW